MDRIGPDIAKLVRETVAGLHASDGVPDVERTAQVEACALVLYKQLSAVMARIHRDITARLAAADQTPGLDRDPDDVIYAMGAYEACAATRDVLVEAMIA